MAAALTTTASMSNSPPGTCLICSAVVKTPYLGMEACRACGEFFRRTSTKGLQYVCRQGKNNCDVSKSAKHLCRSCRYAKCVRVGFCMEWIEGNSSSAFLMSHSNIGSTKPHEVNNSTVGLSEKEKQPFSELIESITEAGTSKDGPDLPLLKKIEQRYRIMCAVRKANEFAYSDTNSLFGSNRKEKILRPATYIQEQETFRINIIVLFELGGFIFDGFSELSDTDKHNIIRGCHYPIMMVENFRRTLEEYPDDPHILLTSETTCVRYNEYEPLYQHIPDEACRKEAEQLFRERCEDTLKLIRPQVIAADMDEIEFLVYIGLTFACIPSYTGSFSEAAFSAAEVFRKRLFREFHLYCRHRLRMTSYASKLGRMMSLLTTCQEFAMRAAGEMELYRMLDLVPEDSYTYKFNNLKES